MTSPKAATDIVLHEGRFRWQAGFAMSFGLEKPGGTLRGVASLNRALISVSPPGTGS